MEPQPYAQTMQREMMAEIEAGRPEYLVWVGYDNSWNVRPSSDRAIFDWFARYSNEFYDRIGVVNGDAGPDLFYCGATRPLANEIPPVRNSSSTSGNPIRPLP